MLINQIRWYWKGLSILVGTGSSIAFLHPSLEFQWPCATHLKDGSFYLITSKLFKIK
jgi:hypothetical protein